MVILPLMLRLPRRGGPVAPEGRRAVFVYNLEDELVAQFPSMTAAANLLGISPKGVSLAVQRGSIVQGKYRVRV